MKVVHLTRKPVTSQNIVSSALEYGTGPIAIDACRISAPGEEITTHTQKKGDDGFAKNAVFGKYAGGFTTHQTKGQKLGRFPANLMIMHEPGCRYAGTRKIKGITGTAQGRMAGNCNDIYGAYGGSDRAGDRIGYVDADGMEEVAAWECVHGCAVTGLDRSSLDGGMHGAGHKRDKVVESTYSASSYDMSGARQMGRYGDSGGASRFYKQFQQEVGMEIVPQDLIDYLHTMITPTKVQLGGDEDGHTLVALDLSKVEWSEYEDESLHGLIAQGDPSPYMDEVWRVLKPGAHVMLIAPPEQPTGHTGACALEDKGFEIRDALVVVNDPSRVHYVPKANPKERNLGCHEIAARQREYGPVYDLLEDTLGEDTTIEVILEALHEAHSDSDDDHHPVRKLDETNIFEMGVPRDAIPKGLRSKHFRRRKDQKNARGNLHPTVKPKELLRRLIEPVSTDAMVLDPFMGSGSMALACLETGHDYIGIERESEYLEIADHRVRYWDAAQAGWKRAEVVSEAPQQEAESTLTLDDLFGF